MNAGKLLFGLVLVVVGTAAFLDAIDVVEIGDLWRFWPVLLIAAGLSSEIEAIRHRRNEGGIFLLAVGVWLLAGSQHWFGLSVGRAFPLGIVVFGLGMLVHAVIDRPAVATREESK